MKQNKEKEPVQFHIDFICYNPDNKYSIEDITNIFVKRAEGKNIYLGGGVSFFKEQIDVKRTERGWAGHSFLANRCRFRRNTLLEANGVSIVVSTVGLVESTDGKGFETIGDDRFFETRAFYTDEKDKRWMDPNFNLEVKFESPWQISVADADDQANDMHETVVGEITGLLKKGISKFKTK